MKEEIENYVSDWYWDDESKANCFEIGKFLFGFIAYLESQNMSERTLKNHKENAYLIGRFEAGYGFNDNFSPEDLTDGPEYVYEFERKVSDSKYAIKLYESTWRKLDKYIKTGAYEEYTELINTQLKAESQEK